MNPTAKQIAKSLALCGALFCALGTAHAYQNKYPNQPPAPKAPKFEKVTSSLAPKTGDLKVCFKETGLSPNKPVSYIAKANVTATFACLNNGGNCPKGHNSTVKATVSESATFTADKYGNVQACITLKAPDPKKDACPGPMKPVLTSISWTNITIYDKTNKVGPAPAYPSKQTANYGACPGGR